MFIYGKENISSIKSIEYGESFKGVQIIKEHSFITFKYFVIPTVHTTTIIYWKPFKKLITEEALPSLIENNKKGNDPYVNIWFEIKEKINKINPFSIHIVRKINMNSNEHTSLESLFKNKVQIERNGKTNVSNGRS